jgi:hypothetical protein
MYSKYITEKSTLFTRLYVRFGILLTCGKHVHDRITTLREEVWAHTIGLTPPLFIEVPVPSVYVYAF